ncbi:DUF5666 domain-containing protein [Variovorax sp. RCC_210]|uniref:DUF5666 domain-containing protein n=1 Tax=Variovorax sp. RCC_210 TaxID=3239217 RepID=UPI0035269B7B
MTRIHRLMRGLLSSAAMMLLLSCGGSGGGDGRGPVDGFGLGEGTSVTPAPAGASDSPAGNGSSAGASGTDAGTDTGSAGTGDATSTAGNGSTDGSGVGSGGTGVTADAAGVGSAGGLGSVILNGVRYNTDAAAFTLEDTSELQIGMSARIAGKLDTNFTNGVATQVQSAAELRGPATGIDVAAGSFVVMGTTVSVDSATVWGNANGLADVGGGSVVQVWGLPGDPGSLRATRVQIAPTMLDPLVTGTVQNLDTVRKTFALGLLTIDYNGAAFTGFNSSALANGTIVRARAFSAPTAGVLAATIVQGWYAIPLNDGVAVQLAGVITSFVSRGAFKLLGTAVDGTTAQINGGPAGSLGNGVKLEVDGFMSGGVLVVKKLRIRNVPGTGGPASFTLIGAIGAYQSPASFRVRGQPVDASGSGTSFINGTVADLGNGRRVTIVGDRVVNGVLIAQSVAFTP